MIYLVEDSGILARVGQKLCSDSGTVRAAVCGPLDSHIWVLRHPSQHMHRKGGVVERWWAGGHTPGGCGVHVGETILTGIVHHLPEQRETHGTGGLSFDPQLVQGLV